MFEPRLKDILKFCKDDIIIEANKNNRIFIFEYFSNCYDYKPITEVLKTLSFKEDPKFEEFFDLKEFLDYKIEEIVVDSYYGITKIILKKYCD